jgi:hypothetical protein
VQVGRSSAGAGASRVASPDNVILTNSRGLLLAARPGASRIFSLMRSTAVHIVIESNSRTTDLWGVTPQAGATREAPA